MDRLIPDKKDGSNKRIGLGIAIYSSASIFGPLVIIGGLGWFLDRQFDTKPWLMLIGIFTAFIFTNFFLYKKFVYFNKILKEKDKAETEKMNKK